MKSSTHRPLVSPAWRSRSTWRVVDEVSGRPSRVRIDGAAEGVTASPCPSCHDDEDNGNDGWSGATPRNVLGRRRRAVAVARAGGGAVSALNRQTVETHPRYHPYVRDAVSSHVVR